MKFSFQKSLNVVSFIFKITRFALVIIVGFDLVVGEVENIALKVMHAEFFMKVALWMKTKSGSNSKQWTFIQIKNPCLSSQTLDHLGKIEEHRVVRGKTVLVPRPSDMWILAKLNVRNCCAQFYKSKFNNKIKIVNNFFRIIFLVWTHIYYVELSTKICIGNQVGRYVGRNDKCQNLKT